MSTHQVRIVAGGSVDPQEEAAIVQAVLQVSRMRRSERSPQESQWARAGRIERSRHAMLRSRAEVPPR